jgi:cell division protein FtsB
MRERSSVRVISFVLLALTLVSVPLLLLGKRGVPRYLGLRKELARVESENERLTREVRELRLETELLRTDPRAIERLARDELGMVRDGEVVFQFPH